MLALTIDGETHHIHDQDKEEAMQRYWQARVSGDQTARLVPVDPQAPSAGDGFGDDEEDPDDDPTHPGGGAVVAFPSTPSGVSTVAAARIAEQDQWLQEAGFALAPPLFTPGTRVTQLGHDNFRLERDRVEALPRFPEAAGRIIHQISKETRDDLHVGLKSLQMNGAGALQVHEHTLGLELPAFRQLAGLGGFGRGFPYLRDQCSPELRADNVNYQLEHTRNRKVVLRTRTGPDGEPQVYAVVTPTYAVADTDQVLGAVQDQLADAHAQVRYDGRGVVATALFMPDEVVDLAAGDVFKVGVRVETDDTGVGRIRVSGVAWRNLCLNLIIIDEGEVETVNLVHRGDPARILSLVAEGVEKARASVGNFLAAWGHARTVRVDPMEIIRSWVEEQKLARVPPGERDAIVEELLSAWRKEPGETLADCVNAVTRAAHEAPDWSLDFREELERRAARLVMVPA